MSMHGVESLLEKGEAREIREVERERSTGRKRREGREEKERDEAGGMTCCCCCRLRRGRAGGGEALVLTIHSGSSRGGKRRHAARGFGQVDGCSGLVGWMDPEGDLVSGWRRLIRGGGRL